MPSSAKALPIEQAFGTYAYNSGCSAPIDPIGLGFTYGNGQLNHVYNHASRVDHGEWRHRTDGQEFWDSWGCSTSDDTAANQPQGCPCDRWHLRYEVDWTDNGGQAYAATPHKDQYNVSNPLGHCLAPNSFTLGRDQVIFQWIWQGAEHGSEYWSWWGNNQPMSSCGQTVQGNGWVAYINMAGI